MPSTRDRVIARWSQMTLMKRLDMGEAGKENRHTADCPHSDYVGIRPSKLSQPNSPYPCVRVGIAGRKKNFYKSQYGIFWSGYNTNAAVFHKGTCASMYLKMGLMQMSGV